jgi:hypothetical protein
VVEVAVAVVVVVVVAAGFLRRKAVARNCRHPLLRKT